MARSANSIQDDESLLAARLASHAREWHAPSDHEEEHELDQELVKRGVIEARFLVTATAVGGSGKLTIQAVMSGTPGIPMDAFWQQTVKKFVPPQWIDQGRTRYMLLIDQRLIGLRKRRTPIRSFNVESSEFSMPSGDSDTTAVQLLAQIKELRKQWASAEDVGPYDPAKTLEELWANMRKLGLSPGVPPFLDATKAVFAKLIKDGGEKLNRERHRTFHEALDIAEKYLKAHTDSSLENSALENARKRSKFEWNSEIDLYAAVFPWWTDSFNQLAGLPPGTSFSAHMSHETTPAIIEANKLIRLGNRSERPEVREMFERANREWKEVTGLPSLGTEKGWIAAGVKAGLSNEAALQLWNLQVGALVERVKLWAYSAFAEYRREYFKLEAELRERKPPRESREGISRSPGAPTKYQPKTWKPRYRTWKMENNLTAITQTEWAIREGHDPKTVKLAFASVRAKKSQKTSRKN